MTALLDRLARIAAHGEDPRPAAEDARVPRDIFLARGALGAMALIGLGRLVSPQTAAAATARCTSLAACLKQADAVATRRIDQCLFGDAIFARWADQYRCYMQEQETRRRSSLVCNAKCPAPKKPPSSPKPKQPSRTPTPPPLPPNPYDDGGLCAACAQVGGVCCWGGQLRGGFCACATPGVDCKAYGCK